MFLLPPEGSCDLQIVSGQKPLSGSKWDLVISGLMSKREAGQTQLSSQQFTLGQLLPGSYLISVMDPTDD